MFERVRTWVLRAVRLPHDPASPAGAPGSERVFRAGHNLYKVRHQRRGLGQLGALAGIGFSLMFLERVERGVEDVRQEVRPAPMKQPAAAPAIAPTVAPETKSDPALPVVASGPVTESPKAPAATKAKSKSRKDRSRVATKRLVERTPSWIFPLLTLLELGGIVLYVVQIPLTFAMVRLDYELRWYIVTDRSLRIRAGLTSVQETTMSFANVQQVVVSQGPLQRLLGIADVRVQSAGGGGEHHESAGTGESLHTGVFHGVDNASEIRDLILDRLRRFRETGLGDPDEAPAMPSAAEIRDGSEPALVAAQELLEEARALRRALV